MGSGEERARTALKSNKILRPKLLLSAALAALIVAAPTGDRTSALAMNLGSNFGAGRFSETTHVNNGPRLPTGNTGNVG